MSQSYTSDDLKTLFAFPFQDTNWKNKFLIGSLVVLSGFVIPLVPFFIVYGYMVQIMRRIIVEKGEPYLPEWDDWGKMLVDGLKLFGAIMVYILPFFLLFCAGFAFFFLSIGLTGAAGAATEQSGETPSPAIAIFPVLGMFGMFATFGILMVFSVILGFMMPAIMGHVVATDEFAAAFRFREWWSIFRANLGGFLIAYIIVMAISVAINFGMYILYITLIFCCLLPFILPPIIMYMIVLQAVVFGQAYREGVQKLQEQGTTS